MEGGTAPAVKNAAFLLPGKEDDIWYEMYALNYIIIVLKCNGMTFNTICGKSGTSRRLVRTGARVFG